METSRIALISYRADGEQYVGSGLLVSARKVLTADHVADGAEHRVKCVGGSEVPVSAVLRSEDPSVDLAVLTLSEPLGVLRNLPLARIDRSHVDQVTGCVAVGFPRWKKHGKRRLTAQVSGWVPTAEGLEPAADDGFRAGYLTLVGDRIPPGAPLIPKRELHEQSGSPWGGMSGAGVVAAGAVIGVVRSINLAAGGQSLTVTPLTALERLPAAKRQLFWAALGVNGLEGISALPASAGNEGVDSSVPTLSEDVREQYLPVLSATLGTSDLPDSWTLEGLSELRRKTGENDEGSCLLSETLSALCHALEAKPVFLGIGASHLGLGQLQVIYRREVGAWPTGWSADALLAEAASASVAERRRCREAGPLGALGRLVVGVAAALDVPPDENDLLKGWLEVTGHQLADARAHALRADRGRAQACLGGCAAASASGTPVAG